MYVNVREWVADFLGSYPDGRELDPRGPKTGEENIQRGGSWGNVGSFMNSRREEMDPLKASHQNLASALP